MIDLDVQVKGSLPTDSEWRERTRELIEDAVSEIIRAVLAEIPRVTPGLRDRLKSMGFDDLPEMSATADAAVEALTQMRADITWGADGAKVTFSVPKELESALQEVEYGSRKTPATQTFTLFLAKIQKEVPRFQTRIMAILDARMRRQGFAKPTA